MGKTMRSAEMPELKFTPWVTWKNRKKIPLCEMPGVYLLAITRKNLDGQTPQWSDVSYIGMTNSRKGLAGRWHQFFNSIRGKKGHSGGNTIFGDLGHYSSWNKNLFVSAMPVKCDVTIASEQDLIKMGQVAYLEYAAFSVFRHHLPARRKPKYNTR
jgi:hypothetical protein